VTVDLHQTSRAIGRRLAAQRGWGLGEFACLDNLWGKLSGWDVHAKNPSSGAYGIPQALPGPKMASEGSDWKDNPETQIKWGLQYIAERYLTPCDAWAHWQRQGWY
jgi:resuscitation-promoting factor RpfB